MLALVTAGKCHEALRPAVKTLQKRFQGLQSRTSYYTPEIHRAAFTLTPAFNPALSRQQTKT
jgi:spermidine synthase